MQNKFLYPCFSNWKGSIWFISDTHFNDAETETFRNINDDDLVKMVNRKVSKNDTLVLLGDVGDVSYVSKLKAGYKVLVMGNHDSGASNYGKKYTVEGKENLFDEVYEGALMINEKIMLSHEPFDTPFTFNIHGHDHNGTDFKKHVLKRFDADMPLGDMWSNYLETVKLDKLKRLNVCAEWIGYSPINLKQIVNSGVLKDISNIHRVTIDKATIKARSRKIKH